MSWWFIYNDMIIVRDISCDIWLFILNDVYVDICKGDFWIFVWNVWFICM